MNSYNSRKMNPIGIRLDDVVANDVPICLIRMNAFAVIMNRVALNIG